MRPSLTQRLSGLEERIEGLPRWARPPFYGMLFAWFLTLAKGGLLLPVIAVVGVLSKGPEALLQLLWLFIALSLAGFAGGAAFSLTRPLFRPLGRWGAIPVGWACVFAYGCVIFPMVSSDDPGSRYHFEFDRAGWIAIAIVSVILGSVLGALFMDLGPRRRKRPKWVQRAQRVTSRVHPPAG